MEDGNKNQDCGTPFLNSSLLNILSVAIDIYTWIEENFGSKLSVPGTVSQECPHPEIQNQPPFDWFKG